MLAKNDVGVVHGRFQIFHLKHMEYILAAKMRCNKLLIGIEGFALYGRSPENPFTYYERMEMIRDSLIDFGLSRGEFEIIPFPAEYPKRIRNFVPEDAVFYLNICGEEDENLIASLEQLGMKTEVLITKTEETMGTTSSEIRDLILQGEEWKHLVPKKVYDYITGYYLDELLLRVQKELEEQTLADAVERLEEETQYLEEEEEIQGLQSNI